MCMSLSLYIYIYICKHKHTYIYIHISTHIVERQDQSEAIAEMMKKVDTDGDNMISFEEPRRATDLLLSQC